MSNSKTVYNDFVRANLPEYIRYDSVRNQYVTVNGKRFVTYKEAKWYTDYIIKNGSIIDRAIGFNIPQTIADFSDDTFTSANKSLGPELVTNGTFDSDLTGWSDISTGTGTAVFDDGTALLTTVDTFNRGILTQAVTTIAGSVYQCSIELTQDNGNTYSRIGTTPNGSEIYTFPNPPVGVQTITFVATGTTTYITLNVSSGSINFDNISVREIVSYSPASTTAESLLTHTRSGNAVQVADDGTLQWAGHNLLKYSEDFSNAAWTKVRADTLAIDATGPDGETSAVTLVDNGATGVGAVYLRQACTVSTSSKHTFSIWAKEDQLDGLRIQLENFTTPASGTEVYYNLSAGTVGTTDAGFDSATIEDFGNGWYLCSCTFTTNASDTTGDIFVAVSDSAEEAAVDLDGTSSILIYGAHLCRSDLGGMADIPTSYRGLSSSSTYLPTTSSARYLPRVDNHIWDGSSWVKRCLVEPQSTNLVTYSEDFTDASWGKLELGVSGEIFTPTTASSLHSLTRTVTGIGSDTYTVFFDVEKNGYDWVGIFITHDFSNTIYCAYNLAAGSKNTPTVTGTTTGDSKIVELGGGIYRCVLTITTTGLSNPYIFLQPLAGSATSRSTYTGDGTSGIKVYRAQLEASSVPTSYIPTAGAQVTRPADALSIDSTLLPYDSTAMTIAMDGDYTAAENSQVFFYEWQEDANNRIFAVGDDTAPENENFRFLQAASGVFDEPSAGSGFTSGVNVPFNIASRHTSSDINGAVDGTALTANTTVTALPDLSATDFQIAPTGVVNIKSLRILGGYGATDAELEAATT
jgi:hypothetical protein